MINQQGKDLIKAESEYNFNVSICVDMHLCGYINI